MMKPYRYRGLMINPEVEQSAAKKSVEDGPAWTALSENVGTLDFNLISIYYYLLRVSHSYIYTYIYIYTLSSTVLHSFP
jgi:hypothetical protein